VEFGGGAAGDGASIGSDIGTDDCREELGLDDSGAMEYPTEKNPVYENDQPRKNSVLSRKRIFSLIAVIVVISILGLLTPLVLRGNKESTPSRASAGKQKTSSGKQGFFMLRDNDSSSTSTGSDINTDTTVVPDNVSPQQNSTLHTPNSTLTTADRIQAVLAGFGETGGSYRLPPEMIERVDHYLGLYMGRRRSTIVAYLRRGEQYFPMIRRVLEENNLPPELAYISMLESGFDPQAVSHAGAVGLWQFMPHTARRYGLEVSARVDERTDPVKSTHAAAAYFKHLIAIFGPKSSVMLCMAAYNAGEQRIINALKRIDDPMRNRDFWYIDRNG
jgi:hypothetical protein